MASPDALVYGEPVAIRAKPFRNHDGERRWYAELTYAGHVFDVPGTYADEQEALRGADAYRASWEVPSERTLAGLGRRGNDPAPYWTPLPAQLADDARWPNAAWRRRHVDA